MARLTLAANVSYSDSKLLFNQGRVKEICDHRFALLHLISRYTNDGETLAYAFSYHDGQSKGGGPSLLILVAILLHILAAEMHNG